MLRIRIVAAGAFAAAAVILAVGGAPAQATAGDQVGKPLSLLAGLRPPHETKTIAHAKAAGKTIKKSAAGKRAAKNAKLASKTHNKIAAAQAPAPLAQPAPVTPPAAVWPVADAVPAANVATATPPETAPPDNDAAPSSVVVSGQTVQVASPDQVNQLDLAADNDVATAATPIDQSDVAPAMQTVLAAPAHEDAGQTTDPVGSVSWFAQVLAALGGALAAGSVAWFLIGSGPVRIYG